jgi:hypothetical protein
MFPSNEAWHIIVQTLLLWATVFIVCCLITAFHFTLIFDSRDTPYHAITLFLQTWSSARNSTFSKPRSTFCHRRIQKVDLALQSGFECRNAHYPIHNLARSGMKTCSANFPLARTWNPSPRLFAFNASTPCLWRTPSAPVMTEVSKSRSDQYSTCILRLSYRS